MRSFFAFALLSLAGCPAPPATTDAAFGSDAAFEVGPEPDALLGIDAAAFADGSPSADAPALADAPPFTGDAACSVGTGPSREFVVLYDDVFVTHGCAMGGCHDGRYAFDMADSVTAYRNLVGVTGCRGVRVTPCSVEDSYLSEVIRIEDGICAGRRHAAGLLSAEEADRIDAWIRAGAR